jgi:hypothetical protein
VRSVAERYVELGLHLDHYVEGTVDAYVGPPEVAKAVADADPLPLPAIVAGADALLAEVDDGWLRDQIVGLRTYASGLAGEVRSYADEVEGCHGVRPAHTDEAVFAAAHQRLDELLPGSGDLADRYERWGAASMIPAELIEPLVTAIMAEARARTADLVDLPAGDGVELTTVRDVPWIAYHIYLGAHRGRVEVNVSLAKSSMELVHLTLHETYPGHQAERSLKEARLARDRGLIEETLVLACTPQSLLTEGIAELGVDVLLDGPGGPTIEAIVRDAGIAFDLAEARAIERALMPCRWAEVNAALLMYDGGADDADVHAYLRRWGLLSTELADHLIRYLREPTSRTYISNYPAGRELCQRFVGDDPTRFVRLLTEQLRVSDLRPQ